MSEIPADVSRAAEPWGEAALIAWTSGAGRAAVMSMVAGAILEERERCAMVARDQPLPELVTTNAAAEQAELTWRQSAIITRDAIAQAIRNPTPEAS